MEPIDNLLKKAQDQTILYNKRGMLLINAILENNIVKIKKILTTKTNLNIQKNEYTPLMYAINMSNKEAIELLLDNGVDVNIVNIRYESALILAIKWKRIGIDLIKKIIDHTADINNKDVFGCSALYYALKYKYRSAILKLIQSGADLNVKYAYGNTALIYAAINIPVTDISILFWFIQAGADLTIKNDDGCNFIDACRETFKKGWLIKLDVQQYILNKEPFLIFSFKKNNIKIRPEIFAQYGYLFKAVELNLINNL